MARLEDSVLRAYGREGKLLMACVYERKDKLLVRSISKNVDGLGIEGQWVEVAAIASDEELGKAVREMLAATRYGIPRWTDAERRSPARERPFLAAAGVRSWSALERGTRRIDVDLADAFSFDPWGPGKSGGFVPLSAEMGSTLPATAGDEELGQAVRAALAVAEARPEDPPPKRAKRAPLRRV